MATSFPRAIVLLVAWACLVPHADAQIVNPQSVSFYPSPDHNRTNADGLEIVAWYGLQFHEYGNPEPLLVFSLGKPDPGPDGRIDVEFRSLLPSPLMPGIPLEIRVVAFGPGGRGESDPSNPFVFSVQSPHARANMPPSVRLMTPPNGAKFALSSRIRVTATASDLDGAIAWVAFYMDGHIAAATVRSPYTVWWLDATAGTHVITAIAGDNDGAQASSSSILITVVRTPPRVAPAGAKPAGAAKPRPPVKRPVKKKP